MDTYSIVFVVGLVVSILGGYLLGFGKTLKFCTGGIIKHVIAVWFCITFGGMIASIPFIASLISQGNEYFGEFAAILAKINLASVIFYIILFIVVELVRLILLFIVQKIFEPKDKKTVVGGVRNIINRALGALLFGAFWMILVWAVLAGLALLTDVNAVSTWITEIAGDKAARLIYALYEHNPIDFTVIFGIK